MPIHADHVSPTASNLADWRWLDTDEAQRCLQQNGMRLDPRARSMLPLPSENVDASAQQALLALMTNRSVPVIIERGENVKGEGAQPGTACAISVLENRTMGVRLAFWQTIPMVRRSVPTVPQRSEPL